MAKGMQQLLKQAQKLQSQMMAAQEDLEKEVIEASAGGGMVKVEMNGKQEVVSVKISPEAVDPDDVEMLEDLIMAAVNQAHTMVQEKTNEKMGSLTGGMNLPGM